MTTASRQFFAEGLGTALLLAAVVGSGIMGERLAGGNAAIALLANTLATGTILTVLIACLGPVSGAHFNPAVTAAMAATGELRWNLVPGYVIAQLAGGLVGVLAAHAMFGLDLWQVSTHERGASGQFLSECVATFGLLLVIWSCVRLRPAAVPWAVGAFITSAYWFTASTSFANPAVTFARTLTNTFAGIRPVDAGPFVLAQCLGAVVATFTCRWLFPGQAKRPA